MTEIMNDLRAELAEQLQNNEDLQSVVGDLNGWDGSLDDLRVYSNDEEFFDIFFEKDVMGAVRAISYGEYNYLDEYVKFDGYNNLVSMSEYDYKQLLENSIDEIVECLIENSQHVYGLEPMTEMLINIINDNNVYEMSTDDFIIKHGLEELEDKDFADMSSNEVSLFLEENELEHITVTDLLSDAVEAIDTNGEENAVIYYVDDEHYIVLHD